MNFSFDLTSQPWISCVTKQGQPVELSLRQLYAQAHMLREVGGESPMVTVALYRLLLTILHRVHQGPQDKEEWGKLWALGQFKTTELDAYFNCYRDRFDLFHPERPFFQAKDERVKLKSVTSLIHDVASGNNGTLFDHHVDEDGLSLHPAQAARYLVAAQAFGLAGLSGLDDKFSYAPCVGGVLFFVQGDTLFQTLLLNWITYDDYSPMPRQKGDAPAWEIDNPYEPAKRTIPKGYLDYLTWQNRRVWFKPEQVGEQVIVREMTMAPGLKLEGGISNPLMYYRIDEKRGPMPLRFSEARALWRDSAALFRLRHEGHRPPAVFEWLAGLEHSGYLQLGARRRILALGMANDQAKMEFFRADRMPLRSEYLQDQTKVDALDSLLKLAEDVARQLWAAANTLARYLLIPESADDKTQKTPPEAGNLVGSWAVERAYWSRLETPFRTVLATLPDDIDQAANEWKETLRRTAWSVFDTVGDNLDPSPRALKAVVNARGQLASGLMKVLA